MRKKLDKETCLYGQALNRGLDQLYLLFVTSQVALLKNQNYEFEKFKKFKKFEKFEKFEKL
jgi:hypothetical protein